MGIPIQVTFDCADVDRMAAFWALALDYVVQPPPPGFDSWEAALTAMGVPYEPGVASAVVDPAGAGPRLFFQRVPEPKTAKNRVHLDVNVGGSGVDAKVARLVEAGATVVREVEEHGERWVVLADPEGNELCVQ